MENLIPVLNKLQEVFAAVGAHSVELPQIVVVGCQSAGKSSVLESVVQRDFLPRGNDICTRRPLLMQLIHIDETYTPKEWGEFAHKPGVKFSDFDKIRQEIEEETDRICGTNKGVVDQEIILKIFSPNVLTLTMVDLPGLTKVAIEDQPKDIAEQIHKMVMRYIVNKNAIILAISPANQDLANSDSLVIAREVDPEGDRTIGVITKLDIMDKGTNARDILLNRVYPLKLGYIGVVNRSQADIVSKRKVGEAAAAERRFFEQNEAYRDIASNCGCQFLAQTLNQILMNHIKNKLPSLYSQIADLLAAKRLELEKYGSTLGNTLEEQQVFLFELVSKYMDEFNGRLFGFSDQLSRKHIAGGAIINSQLVDEFPQKMLQIKSVKELDENTVKNLMKQQAGLSQSMFFPEATFHTLVRLEIEKLRPVCVEAIESAKRAVLDIHEKIEIEELKRFVSLKDSITRYADEVMNEATRNATTFAKQMIDIQKAFINPNHPDFQCKQQMEIFNSAGSDNVSMLIDLVHKYYIIVRKQLIDAIPKAIYRFMIHDAEKNLRFTLVEKLVLQPDINEDPQVVEKRRSCIRLIEALEKASNVLAEVRKAHI